MTTRPIIYRQGDVLLVRVGSVEVGAKVRRRAGRGLVLAEGEATGHHHRIVDRGAELFESRDPELEDRFLRVLADGGVELLHEEHAAITIPPGEYLVRRQREYEPAAPPRTVMD